MNSGGLDLGMDWSAKSPLQWEWENPGFSSSVLGNGSSSIDSSAKEGGANSGSSPVSASAVGPGESLIGLKLGRRTYFEDPCAGNNAKGSAAPAPAAVFASAVKKTRVSGQSTQSTLCQVEGCDIDLTGAKDYHRKHRVCLNHSKSPKVVISGLERRFCQQCSRFHDLSEFDQNKRSCRRRLSDHNARRRKPQRETIAFNSSRLCSSFYDETQQMNFLVDRTPFGHGRTAPNSTWENSRGFSITHAKESWNKSSKAGCFGGQLLFSNSQLSDTVPALPRDLDKLFPFKVTNAEVLNQGLEASVASSNLDRAPELQRALSLLSNDSWGPTNPMQTNIAQFVTSSHSSAAHPSAQAVNTTSSGFWQQDEPLPQHARVSTSDHLHINGGHYQEFQRFKSPYEMTFFDSGHMLSKPDDHFLEFKT